MELPKVKKLNNNNLIFPNVSSSDLDKLGILSDKGNKEAMTLIILHNQAVLYEKMEEIEKCIKQLKKLLPPQSSGRCSTGRSQSNERRK